MGLIPSLINSDVVLSLLISIAVNSVIKEKLGDMIVLVCFGTNRQEVFDEINRISKEQELYFPDVPVYGNDIFNSYFVFYYYCHY